MRFFNSSTATISSVIILSIFWFQGSWGGHQMTLPKKITDGGRYQYICLGLLVFLMGCVSPENRTESCPAELKAARPGIPWEPTMKGYHWLGLGPTYPPVTYDRYLTFRDYDGLGDPERALFIWQGQEIGRGSTGLQMVIQEMENLPPGSRILIYPDYWDLQIWDGPGSAGRHMPFDPDLWDAMRDVALSRKLTMMFSQRDHLGVLPEEVEQKAIDLVKAGVLKPTYPRPAKEEFRESVPWESDYEEDHVVHLEPEYPAVPFDFYLTWKDYDGRPASSEHAMFLWQGNEMGRGSEGFRAVIAEMRQLLPGTRILIYPDYSNPRVWSGSPAVGLPFPADLKAAMHELAISSGLILMYSQRDHFGEQVWGAKSKARK
jgi:hypothetical protein